MNLRRIFLPWRDAATLRRRVEYLNGIITRQRDTIRLEADAARYYSRLARAAERQRDEFLEADEERLNKRRIRDKRRLAKAAAPIPPKRDPILEAHRKAIAANQNFLEAGETATGDMA